MYVDEMNGQVKDCSNDLCCYVRKARAFTLLELFLVLAVMIALASIIWPALGGKSKAVRLKSSAERLSVLLRLARNGSMAEGREYRCVFRRGGTKVVIESQVDPLINPDEFERIKSHWSVLDLSKDGVRCVSVELDEWEKLLKEQEKEVLEGSDEESEEYDPIRFYPTGESDSAVIVLGDDANDFVSIEYDGLTGTVNVIEGNVAEENEKANKRY